LEDVLREIGLVDKTVGPDLPHHLFLCQGPAVVLDE
jgi:hypothetical protein